MSSDANDANVVLSFPERLHGPLLSALERRERSGKGEKEDLPLVCSLDDASGEAKVTARRDLDAGELFLFDPVVSGTRSRLAALAVGKPGDEGDDAVRSAMREVVVEALMADRERGRERREPKDDDEASDPLLGNLWRWLIPAGVGACRGSGGRPDARWTLPPREISWIRHRGVESSASPEEPASNARVSLLTLDDGPDADERREEERLLLALWLERGVARGEELTVDWSFEEPSDASRSSLRRAASLVARLGEARWAGEDGAGVWRALSAAVTSAARESGPSSSSPAATRRPSPAVPLPPFPARESDRVLVWTDYPVFSEWLDSRRDDGDEEEVDKFGLRFRRAADRPSADFVLTRLPLRSFRDVDGVGKEPGEGSPQLCNQFPYEGALVRKDLLPSTLRGACDGGRAAAADAPAAVSWPPSPDGGLHPPFFPPTYDLSTELHYLLESARGGKGGERTGGGEGVDSSPPYWVLKPAAASRSLGLSVTSSLPTVAAFAAKSCSGGDRVAQRYVERPLLTVEGNKFDLRVLVVVRSFGGGSPSASMYRKYHARVAPARYSPPPRKGTREDDEREEEEGEGGGDERETEGSSGDGARGLIDQDVFGTVACYNTTGSGGDSATKERGKENRGSPFLSRDEVDATLSSKGHDPLAVDAAIASLARSVVSAASTVIGGPWPRSRAVYGLDVVLDESEETTVCFPTETTVCFPTEGDDVEVKKREEVIPTPRLLEVNFAPDLEFAAEFNPDLPGQLLREMLAAGEGGGDDGLFVSLF